MIPKNIKKEHIIRAIEEIEKVGYSKYRHSKKFLLEYKNKHYSPKYVISLANKYANGKELYPSEFSGGNESNKFLENLGFNIIKKQFIENHTLQPQGWDDMSYCSKISHNERCKECKKTIKVMLEKIYGKVEQNYRYEVRTRPKDFKNTLYYNELKDIYGKLKRYRGYEEFVRAEILPNCDFFIPEQNFIVEFDESQHFTEMRKITLENYPEKLELGFDRKKWIELCEKINSKDNNPSYRDEQRAWYDTLRDFLPSIKGLKPTVRLFSKDCIWCNFDPNISSDVEKFKSILTRVSKKDPKIEIKEE